MNSSRIIAPVVCSEVFIGTEAGMPSLQVFFCPLRVLGLTPRVLRLAWGTFVFFGFYEMQLKCLYAEKSD
jgi:hypothetical protein